MKERPILFSGPMVRAILDGRKTQTRRSVSPMPGRQRDWLTADLIAASPRLTLATVDGDLGASMEHPGGGPLGWIRYPYGAPGDRMWVRETWRYHDWTEEGEPWIRYAADDTTAGPLAVSDDWTDRVTAAWEALSAPENFAIDAAARDRKWRPSIFMPRWASRLTLDVIAVRVERLQAISEDDARAEGAPTFADDQLRGAGNMAALSWFRSLWDDINGNRASWESNPWVWVVEFKRAEVRK